MTERDEPSYESRAKHPERSGGAFPATQSKDAKRPSAQGRFLRLHSAIAAFRSGYLQSFRVGQGKLADLAAWLALALATLIIAWPLGLTNRILAGVDAFTYFAPYWDFRMAALRAGQTPLWNPYLFLGVPFLANPQAAVLYPLHWPLSWLTAEQALVWSALLHLWLAAGFTYVLARRSFGLSRPGACLAAIVFGLGGFTLAHIENVNQLNTLAWLPALLWLSDETVAAIAHPGRRRGWRSTVRWGLALALVIALCLLAGHTQSFFVNMVGLGAWTVFRTIQKPGFLKKPGFWTLRHFIPLLAVIPAVLLAAAQLLPTLELNGLGLRTGGLPFRQAVSFSLRPRLLAQTFLPPFGGGLGEAFGSEGYAEFVGYVGVVALVLAGVAIAKSHFTRVMPSWESRAQPAQGDDVPLLPALGLAALGVFLALGAYNPVYYLLWRFVPGFDLFRAPARWLVLFALGAALLAGSGLDALKSAPHAGRQQSARLRHTRSRTTTGLLIVVGLGLIVLIAFQQPPPVLTLIGWIMAGLAAAVMLRLSRHWPNVGRGGLIALVLVELWLGSRALPYTQATAPLAADLRNAPAALLAATADQAAAGRARFLSLSDIRYDPGDLAELRGLQADRLPAEAVERLVRAAKQVEVIAPNLPLRFRLPAVDGYDGGLLPLGRYVELQSLFLPAEQIIPDGRLREQLTQVPVDRLLDLTGVRFIITDKQRDLWADDVYYDLENTAPLAPGQVLTFDLTAYPAFSATSIGIVAETAAAGAGGELTATLANGERVQLILPAIATYVSGSPTPHLVTLPHPGILTALSLRNTSQQSWALRGLSLIDARTGAHASVTVSRRGDLRRIHTGDVKLYARTDAPGRAWLVHGVSPVASDTAALAALSDPAFDARATAVVDAELAAQSSAPAGPGETVTIIAYEAERLVLHAHADSPAVLVVADSFYPGWEATVDGRSVTILRANLLFRGVALTPGDHEIIFTYRPTTWRQGLAVSLGALALTALGLLSSVFLPGRQGV